MPVRNLIKRSAPDIIHIHSPAVLGNIAQLLAGGLRRPVIVTNHYLPINVSRSLTADPLLGKYFSIITYSYLVHFCNRCDYVTAPTKTALDLLYEHGLHAPAQAISNGIDLQKFTPGPSDPRIRQQFNLPTDRPLILHVNRLSEEKRVNVLIEAARHMTGNGHIVLVGIGPAETELKELARALGVLDSKVSFLGYVRDDDLLALRRSSAVFAIPSEADLQSISTMEAMACGLPVVAADAYALPELVHHEENGFLFEPGNSQELAFYLDLLLNKADLRARMGQESLKIIAKHDRVEVLNQWEALYNRLAKEFLEAKERKQRLRMMRKYPGVLSASLYHSRIQRTGELGFDRPPSASRRRIVP